MVGDTHASKAFSPRLLFDGRHPGIDTAARAETWLVVARARFGGRKNRGSRGGSAGRYEPVSFGAAGCGYPACLAHRRNDLPKVSSAAGGGGDGRGDTVGPV